MPTTCRSVRAAARRQRAARRCPSLGSSSSSSRALKPRIRNAINAQTAYRTRAGNTTTDKRRADGFTGVLASGTVWQMAVWKCEPVLFMLMPVEGCEGNHVDGTAPLTILRLPHYPEVGDPRCTCAARPKTPIEIGLSNTAVAVNPNTESADPAVSRFLDAVWMERGLSPNTLAAYRADLTALARWLAERNVQIMRTTRADLQDFIAWRVRAGARPRSTARQLSSFRRFFRYFMREGVIRDDPTAQIAMPKIGRSLPRSLSEEEVESLLSAPVLSDPLGNRDRTMLEVLYATGLRVSELVNLRQAQVNVNQGVIRILGKGNRERLIPLGEEAMRALKEFTRGARGEILLERQTDYLFPHPDPPGRPHDAPGLLAHHQALRPQGRDREGSLAPYPAACLRHASVKPRRRPARRADAARPQ